MSTSNNSNGSPSLDTGTPATSDAGNTTSEKTRLSAVFLCREAHNVLAPLQGALSLARFAMLKGCLFNGMLEAQQGKNAAGRPLWDVVDWLPVRDLLKQTAEDAHAFACGPLAEWDGESFRDEFYAALSTLWELTHPMLLLLRHDEEQEEITEFCGKEAESWMYTLHMFEGQAARAEKAIVEIGRLL